MNYTITLTDEQIKLIIEKYPLKLKLTTPYMTYRAQVKNSTITIYTTKKLLIQGEDSETIYKEILSLISAPTKPTIIGTDEVGTGDYFGGITVCGCYVPQEKHDLLIRLGVKDSKVTSDEFIFKIAPELIKSIKHEVILLSNEKYNEIMAFPEMNMNKIKAIMHNKVICRLVKENLKYEKIIIDGFTTKNKYFEYLTNQSVVERNVELVSKAESSYLAVAAASIIARYHFLKHLDELRKKYALNLPKGAGFQVDEVIKDIIKSGNEDILKKIAKVNFINTTKVKNNL